MKGVAPVGALLVAMTLFAGAASPLSYTISVQTSSHSYAGATTVLVFGQVSPAPGPNTAVLLRVFNPNKLLVTAEQVSVNGTTGLFSNSFVVGGSSAWPDGTYVLNATWGAYGSTIFSTATFSWSSQSTTTATTMTSTTTSTTQATSTTTTGTSTTSGTSATGTSTSISSTVTSDTVSSLTGSSSSGATSTTTSNAGSPATPETTYLVAGLVAVAAVAILGFVMLRRRM